MTAVKACPDTTTIIFSEKSKRGIEKIRRMRDVGRRFPGLLAGGVFVSIFAGNGPLQASYTITATDWEHLALAMRSAPDFVRSRIEQEALLLALDHHHDPVQRAFWEAVADGCNLD